MAGERRSRASEVDNLGMSIQRRRRSTVATVTMRDVPIYFGGTGLKVENYENGDLNREVCIIT